MFCLPSGHLVETGTQLSDAAAQGCVDLGCRRVASALKHPATADPVHDERGVRSSGLGYRPADWPKLTTYQCPSLCLCSAARMATAARSPAISSATAHVRTQRLTPAPSRISQRSPPDS